MEKYTIAPPLGSTNNSVGASDRPWQEGHFNSVKLNGGDLGTYLAESTGYGIVSGCTPSISGLTVTVGAGVVHLADGTRKEMSATNITLDAADSTNPRIDLVYIDSTGTVAKITGTAAASPSAPALPNGGISVAQVSVATGATTGTVTDSRDFALSTNKNVMTVKEGHFGTLIADNVTMVFDTVADMIADTSLKAGMTAKTMGYYSVNDGGGTVYIISDNQGDYAEQLSNDLYANLAGDVSHINVKQFGIATGDNNATRNTNIFKNLLTSVESKNYKNIITIYFPAGDYYFNDTISFNFNISLIGDGINKTIIHDLSENVNWFMIINHTVNRLYNFVLSNLEIQGNNQNHSGVLIQSMGWTGLIDNVRIRYFKKSGLAAYDVYDTRVDTLEILNCGENDYALQLTAYSNTASTNAWHTTGLHIERCRYMLKLGYAMNNQFSCCKFEFNGDECNTDNVGSPILLTTGAMWNSFSQCSFIAISVTAWRSILSNPSFIPAPFITVATDNHNRGTNLIDTCEFVSANDGAMFLKFDDCIVNNCFFDLTYGGTDTIKSVTMTDYLSQLKGCTFKVIESTEGYKNVVDMQDGFLTDCFFWGYADRQGVTVINSDSIWKTAGQINDTNRYYNINGIKNV